MIKIVKNKFDNYTFLRSVIKFLSYDIFGSTLANCGNDQVWHCFSS